jgi:hypothetical protein
MAKRIKVKGRTPPSSTRKKLVKPGNRKFIGPRELEKVDPPLSKEGAEYIEIHGGYDPRYDHEFSRGVRKAEARAVKRPVEDSARARGNEKVSADRAELLKSRIASEAGSREGQLFNKLLELLKKRRYERLGIGSLYIPPV